MALFTTDSASAPRRRRATTRELATTPPGSVEMPCPSCDRNVYPNDGDDGYGGEGLACGSECRHCREDRERLVRENAEAEAAWERERRSNGLFGWLRG
ncbi:hypothetical protein ABZZ36_37310 [Actinacidiphila glaucinigra]|uniref:hypothetical protein n=1 Tax=Actinacidiphila glaucinigra TaxID=235986 RepID=UPI0033AB90BA